jgi:GT2 family glycosyltransferase
MNLDTYYIILVNYCNAGLTIDCIKSLNEAGCHNERIIVIDNNSPDDSCSILSKIPEIILIKSTVNGGFSAGNNIGINYALENDCEYILLLNNDTIVDQNFLNQIFTGICNDTINVPKIYYYSDPNRLWYAGGTIDYKRGLQYHYGENDIDTGQYSKEKFVNYATGCCMLIPVSVLKKVGLLDEQFFMYWEDLDYSIRLNNANVKIHYIPDAKVWHKVGMSSGVNSKAAIYYGNRNRFFVLKKYRFGMCAWMYTLSTRVIRYLLSLVNKSNDKIILDAWNDFKKGKMGKVDL